MKHYYFKALVKLLLLAVAGYMPVSYAQVFYPSYQTTVPMITPTVEGIPAYDTPTTPIRVPTVPPNGAHGLEHQSAYVIPGPRVITQRKMGLVPWGYNTPAVTSFVTRPSVVTRVTTPRRARYAVRVPTTVQPEYITTAPEINTSYVDVQEQHAPAYSRFFTQVPTTTYSDELPIIVTITPAF